MISELSVHVAYVIVIPPNAAERFLDAASYCQIDFGEFIEMAIRDRLEEVEAAMKEAE